MSVLSATNLHKSVRLPSGERLHILKGASLVIGRGESCSVVGRSGSGKSTLLAILGLLTPSEAGTLILADRNVGALSDPELSRLRSSHLGFVFQGYSLIHHLTAAENVALPLLHGAPVTRGEARRRVSHVMDAVQMGPRARSRPRQLSSGEQQRTAIARALVRSPAIILADEPTGALDVETADIVLDVLLSAARQDGAAVVLVTHDPLVAARTDRRLHLDDGVLHEEQ